MIIPVIRAFLLFSLLALLGTDARTLPAHHGRKSIVGRPSGPSEDPSPQVDPPHHNVISISFGTGSLSNMITRPSQAPPPPPLPNGGPPLHTSAYQEWSSIFSNHEKTPQSHPSPHVAPGHEQGKLMSIPIITSESLHEEIIKRQHLSSPPPPHVAPPHVQTIPTVPQRVHAYSDNEAEKFKWLSPF